MEQKGWEAYQMLWKQINTLFKLALNSSSHLSSSPASGIENDIKIGPQKATEKAVLPVNIQKKARSWISSKMSYISIWPLYWFPMTRESTFLWQLEDISDDDDDDMVVMVNTSYMIGSEWEMMTNITVTRLRKRKN
nr:DDB1- and CUL4-associated factor 8 isoform X2 [Ipomoea batatas]